MIPKARPSFFLTFVLLLAFILFAIAIYNNGSGSEIASFKADHDLTDSSNLRLIDKDELASLCCNCDDGKKKINDNKREKKVVEYRSTMPEHHSYKDAHYTFTEASKYEGPVVKGWPPQKSRNMNLYIKPQKNTILTGEALLQLIKNAVIF